ncbi:RagB/SusD family nutrient uptake outer membrane protein [Mucilaginibacter sp. Mucisp86]|uniref:RagB/SusD family nutrient uptake outer membrane protein n=1 Tax=Mucilaginibacter sp. Mucisp86 TaxID=3243060 RepID=UPI0039B61E93
MKQKIQILTFLFLILLAASCKKDWLDQKRDSSLIVPKSLKDMRLLLNNNYPYGVNDIGLAEQAADNFTIADNYYSSLYSQEQFAYIWSDQTFSGISYVREWEEAYQEVLLANVILDGLNKITQDSNNQTEYNDIKGGALFLRSRAFYSLAQMFAPAYDSKTASADLGIPLRLNPDINEKSFRATVQQTYDRITGDLKEAASLLKIVPAYKTDSSRPAAYGLLARCYLSMGMYDQAFLYADLSLKDYSKLLDYNSLDATADYPISLFNDEVVFDASINAYASFAVPVCSIATDLINSYDGNDLRKQVFYVQNTDGTFSFKGNYSGSDVLFGGISTDEQYLIRSECAARSGNVAAAMTDLNILLKTRFKVGTFTSLVADNQAAALTLILKERRKELLMRGIRWSDLRRLNKEPAFATTLKKTVNGQTYSLSPNDKHYTFLIPDYIIKASGLQQNAR